MTDAASGAEVIVLPGVGRCDACDGPLDADYRADPDDGARVCSKCDDEAAVAMEGRGSCTQDSDYVCTGWCSECEVNQ